MFPLQIRVLPGINKIDLLPTSFWGVVTCILLRQAPITLLLLFLSIAMTETPSSITSFITCRSSSVVWESWVRPNAPTIFSSAKYTFSISDNVSSKNSSDNCLHSIVPGQKLKLYKNRQDKWSGQETQISFFCLFQD
jgi:hypothetical protein